MQRIFTRLFAALAMTLPMALSGQALAAKVIYTFEGGSDGSDPRDRLLNVGGTLFGTTYSGGAFNGGTVFSVTPDGTENIVYSFKGGQDGSAPYAPLINVDGTLYGTTYYGGAHGYGTVFSITPAGVETVLYSFNGGADAANPLFGLVFLNGTFYGTTQYGGAFSEGTAFSVTPDGVEKVIHTFSGTTDGATPQGELVAVNGTLYGITLGGGQSNCPLGCGTVFSLTTSGAEALVYSFHGGSDGSRPSGRLLYVGGKLYGTTTSGGSDNSGTVFAVSRGGSERVVYAFKGGLDGNWPLSGVIERNGTLYGLTSEGGGTGCYKKLGCGTVFAVTPAGVETVLFAFKRSSGAGPLGGLTPLGNKFYGTASFGTKYNAGTVFRVSP